MDPRQTRPARRALTAVSAAVLAFGLVGGLAACTGTPDDAAPTPSLAAAVGVDTDLGASTVTLPTTDPAELALAASRLVFTQSPILVVAARDDADAARALGAVATALHAPALLADGPADRAVSSEAKRLGARVAVVVEEDPDELAAVQGSSQVREPSAEEAARAAGLRVVRLDPESVVAGGAQDGTDMGATDGDARAIDHHRYTELLDQLGDAAPTGSPKLLTEVLALVDPHPGQEAALATLRAAGAVTLDVPGGDPGASGAMVRTLADAQALTVVGVGPGFASPATFAWQVASADRGSLLPTGNQRVQPARFDAVEARVGEAAGRLAATDAQPAPGTVPVVPTLVLRAATRQWTAGPDGTYLRAETLDALTPVVEQAKKDGRYVVLELDGGSVALLDQVKALDPLLAQGGVGVLVHPEQRRSGAGLVRGGQVDVAELQAVVDHLAELTVKGSLPQVLLAVHSLDTAVTGVGGLTVPPQVAVVDAAALEVTP